jgi:uncharacterized protein (DUF2267 family)
MRDGIHVWGGVSSLRREVARVLVRLLRLLFAAAIGFSPCSDEGSNSRGLGAVTAPGRAHMPDSTIAITRQRRTLASPIDALSTSGDDAMPATGLEVFDTTLQRTHNWLNELMQIMDWQDKHRAYSALRATLHALRDRLTIEEVAQLGAQLPMLIRGIYYEGWKPADTPVRERHKEQFLARLARPLPDELPAGAEEIARGVFRLLATRISEGEIDDVRHVLPAELQELWP